MHRALAAIAVLAIAFAAVGCSQSQEHDLEVTVFKSATCECCNEWIGHLEEHGFSVKFHNVQHLDQIKQQYGVSPQVSGCHTAHVGNYVIEGHVPASDIKRLLAEQPDVAGLSVPGMPVGSPGMEGPHTESFDVLTFDRDGNTAVFASY